MKFLALFVFDAARLSPGALCLDEEANRLGEFGVDTVEVEDPDLGEECLVQTASHLVRGLAVELDRIGEQFEPATDVVGASAEVVGDSGELGGEDAPLVLDRRNSFPRPRGGHASVGDEVDQVICLDAEPLQLVGELVSQELLGASLVCERVIDRVVDGVDERGPKLNGAVVLDDGVFDGVEGHVS